MQKKGFGGECWGSCEPQKILGGEFLEKCQRKKCDAVGMVRNEKRENFPQKNLGDFFRGGRRIEGDVSGGDCWEIKDKIGGKKISGGQKFGGGTFGGNAKKGVEKLFGGSVGGDLNPNKFQGGIF